MNITPCNKCVFSGESFWSVLQKSSYLNVVRPYLLLKDIIGEDFFSRLKRVNLFDPPLEVVFRFSEANKLSHEVTLKSTIRCFYVAENPEFIACQRLRYCPICVKKGWHLTAHQIYAFDRCPIHRVTLLILESGASKFDPFIASYHTPQNPFPGYKCRKLAVPNGDEAKILNWTYDSYKINHKVYVPKRFGRGPSKKCYAEKAYFTERHQRYVTYNDIKINNSRDLVSMSDDRLSFPIKDGFQHIIGSGKMNATTVIKAVMRMILENYALGPVELLSFKDRNGRNWEGDFNPFAAGMIINSDTDMSLGQSALRIWYHIWEAGYSLYRTSPDPRLNQLTYNFYRYNFNDESQYFAVPLRIRLILLFAATYGTYVEIYEQIKALRLSKGGYFKFSDIVGSHIPLVFLSANNKYCTLLAPTEELYNEGKFYEIWWPYSKAWPHSLF